MSDFARYLPLSQGSRQPEPRVTGNWSSEIAVILEQVADLLDGRRVGVVGFGEFRNSAFTQLAERGLEHFDLEYDVQAFNERLPRVRIIPIDEFDPVQFL